ncbi:MAG: YceI family protein [Trebonia sp.]
MAEITGTYRLGPQSGRLILRTGRAGLAAKAGHDLVIEVTRWSAEVTVPGADGGGLAAAAITVQLDLGSLAVREGSGGAKPLGDKDRRDIEATARRILGGGGDTSARFASSAVVLAGSGGAIEGTLTIRGRSRPVRLDLTSPASGQYRGAVTVRQTEFGITPYSGFFGALKLRDEIAVEIEADLNRAQR